MDQIYSATTTPQTVSEYAEVWIAERRAACLDWKNDESRLRHHVLPVLGGMPLKDVRKKHLIALFKALRAEGKLAPATIRNIYSGISALLRDSEDAELIEQAPAKLTAKHLGKLRDKDPSWRGQAVFTRDEVEMIISDERIPEDRRMLYGLDFLAGVRHGEAAALRWRHYDETRKPLGELRIEVGYRSDEARVKSTKTGAIRYVPVHPVLASMLAEWKLAGWERLVGRPPRPDDLIVPLSPADAARRKSRRRELEPFRDKNYSGKRWREIDLPTLGLRHRRKHDTRATLISLACDDGARPDIIEHRVTHTKKSRSAFDGYRRGVQWEETCAEIMKLKIERKRGVVVPIRYSVVTAANGSGYIGVEAPGVEPGSEEESERASTCVANKFGVCPCRRLLAVYCMG